MIFFQSKKTSTTSSPWKHILDCSYIIKKCLVWILCDSKSINWMKKSSLVNKINLNMSQHIIENVKVSDFISFTSTRIFALLLSSRTILLIKLKQL